MWDRKELKALGKVAFKNNYWKCVLVAFLMMLLIFGSAGSAGRRSQQINWNATPSQQQSQSGNSSIDLESLIGDTDVGQSIDQLPPEIQQAISSTGGEPDMAVLGPVVAIVAGIVGVIALVGSLAKILLLNPLEVGCRSFFLHNSEAPASLNDVGTGFQDWGRNVWTMFLRGFFTFLWGLLFVIPGIVKGYSYRLVPYLLAEDPGLRGTDAINLSKKLMRGHKWNTFVLDLSFLGWEILSGLTAGLLGIFYVNPYKFATDAELYRAIRDSH